ncbi:MAG TPA: FecR domain-containing protein [Puia sp.]|nr:FecR domain-containing protein [Puia sp.]
MRYDQSYIVRLIAKYLTEGLTPKEQAILDEWVAESEVNRSIMEEIDDPERFARILEDYEYVDPEIAWQELVEREPELLKMGPTNTGNRTGWVFPRLNRFRIWIGNHRRLAINFSLGFVILVLVVTTLFRLPLQNNRNGTPVYVHEPLSPAGYGASLQLAGGPVLELANLALGFIGSRGGLHFSKTEDGKIVITAEGRGDADGRDAAGAGALGAGAPGAGAPGADKELAGILRTPKGAWYTAVLADRTVVSLNAGSKLELYACNGGLSREVTLTGEAYFDVAPGHGEMGVGRPFVVHVKRGEANMLNIICLGTRFNVKAYEGGHILAALDQGKIQLEKGGQVLTTLDPGEAVMLDDNGVHKLEGRSGAASSWKDGKFDFKQEPVDQILDDLGRWYDARVVHTDKRPIRDTVYSLIGYRKQSLDTLVGRLSQAAGFHYRIDAGTVYVWH